MNRNNFALFCWLLAILRCNTEAWSDASIASGQIESDEAVAVLSRLKRQSVHGVDNLSVADSNDPKARDRLYERALATCKSAAPNCSHYCELVVSPGGNLSALCRCYEGFSLGASGSCVADRYLEKQCNVSKGACSGHCASNQCQCSGGLSATAGGYCKDVDECLQNNSICSGLGKRCVNLYGAYTCTRSDKEPSSGAAVAGIYNEQQLLDSRLLVGLAAWIGVLLLIIGALLITYCCLPPVMPSPEFFNSLNQQR